jgi:hypothetical protein
LATNPGAVCCVHNLNFAIPELVISAFNN